MTAKVKLAALLARRNQFAAIERNPANRLARKGATLPHHKNENERAKTFRERAQSTTKLNSAILWHQYFFIFGRVNT